MAAPVWNVTDMTYMSDGPKTPNRSGGVYIYNINMNIYKQFKIIWNNFDAFIKLSRKRNLFQFNTKLKL